ncbi:MAG: hypothetical protein IAE67_07640 [Candidatus Competibacteraceae bacterium]|nr:hypothetical protein [Candidatus Competibacteraceae bacterium]
MQSAFDKPTPICPHCHYVIQLEKDFWFCEKCFFAYHFWDCPAVHGYCKNCAVKDDELECPKCFERSHPWDWFVEGDQTAEELKKLLGGK